jgi:uncharacterized membrane protein
MKINWNNWDLFVIFIFEIIAIPVILFSKNIDLKTIIGLVYLLFVPGYAVLCAIFPKKESITLTIRIVLSFGLSISISPVLGIINSYIGLGLSSESILLSISAFTMTFSGVSYYIRIKNGFSLIYIDSVINIFTELLYGKMIDKILTMILVIALLSFPISIFLVNNHINEIDPSTTFYILGENRTIESIPHSINPGTKTSITIGIDNNENRIVNYSIEIWIVNFTGNTVNKLFYYDEINVKLKSGAAENSSSQSMYWLQNYSFTVNITGQYKLWFILYKDTVPSLTINPQRYEDFSNSTAVQRIYDCIDNKYQSININIL